jgi:hypothetical protein
MLQQTGLLLVLGAKLSRRPRSVRADQLPRPSWWWRSASCSP